MAENSPGLTPDAGAGAQRQQNPSNADRRQSNQPNRANVPNTRRFLGACKEIEHHTFNLGSRGHKNETFQKTVRMIAEHIGQHIKGAGVFRNGMLKMSLPPLTEPARPNDVNDPFAMEDWKLERRQYFEERKKRADVAGQVFPIILGQTSPAVKDIIEADDTYADINDRWDVIGLLKLIRKAVVSQRTTQHPVHSLYDALTAFWALRQGKLENSDYLERFKDLHDVVVQKGGDIGTDSQRVEKYLQTRYNVDSIPNATPEQLQRATAYVKEEFLAVTFLFKADRRRYHDLLIDIENEYTRNPSTPTYPATLTHAYELIVNYKPRSTRVGAHGDEGGCYEN